VVDQAFAAHARADSRRFEQIHRALLEHARAHAMLDVFTVAVFQDDGIDARAVKEVRQHEPRRARADDADLGSLRRGHAVFLLACPAQEKPIEIRIVQELRRRPVERRGAPSRAQARGSHT
jgi:hypothetical protein